MSWREISVDSLLALKRAIVVDVRSPCEREEECLPGSVSVPLLSNEERSVIGTIYKNEGEMVARLRALRYIAPKIPEIVERICELHEHGSPIVIHCWRGGLRSEAVASVLAIAGLDCFRLTGGYKAWRGKVLQDLKCDLYPFQAIVLRGQTGAGKTELLQALQGKGYQTLDLEALANHRGSVFGGLGLADQPTQKNFEAAIWMQLRSFNAAQPVLIEAESRKVGKLAVPDCVYKRIIGGTPLLVTGSLQTRAERLITEYLSESSNRSENIKRGLSLLAELKQRLGGVQVKQIHEMVDAGDTVEAVKLLLSTYYDPHYDRHLENANSAALEVSSDSMPDAIDKVSSWLNSRPENRAEAQSVRH